MWRPQWVLLPGFVHRGGAFGAILVDETQANTGHQDDADDDRQRAVAEEDETTAVVASSANTRWVRRELGPYRINRADASALDSPNTARSDAAARCVR